MGMDYTNNAGLRMKSHVGPKTTEEKRILMLGDSFTEAEGVSDERRFYHLLEERLRQAGTVERWRVLNAGIKNGCPSSIFSNCVSTCRGLSLTSFS